MPPLVSVVMAVFNDADCVSAAIESIRRQSLADWELVIVNDGSTDATRDVVDRFAALDQRIRVIEQENSGLTRALIHGCDAARGELIARQDADDVSRPARLECQSVLLASRPEVGLVSCWAEYVGPQGEPLETIRRPGDPDKATSLLVDQHQGPPAHGSVMFRRSLYKEVGGYRPPFYFAQDIDLWLRMTERALLGYVVEPLYRWRRCVTGISASRHAQQQALGDLAFACRAARDNGESEEELLSRAEAIAEQARRGQSAGRSALAPSREMSYIVGTQLAQRGDRRARRYLWNVVRSQPWHWRAWVRMAQSEVNARRFGDPAAMTRSLPHPTEFDGTAGAHAAAAPGAVQGTHT